MVDAYRAKLRDDLPGVEGDEVARKRVEAFANKLRPATFLVVLLMRRKDQSLLAVHAECA